MTSPWVNLEDIIHAALGCAPWAVLNPQTDSERWRVHDGIPTMGEVSSTSGVRIMFNLRTDPTNTHLPVHLWWYILLTGLPDDPPTGTGPDFARWLEEHPDVEGWFENRFHQRPGEAVAAYSTGDPPDPRGTWVLTGVAPKGPCNPLRA